MFLDCLVKKRATVDCLALYHHLLTVHAALTIAILTVLLVLACP